MTVLELIDALRRAPHDATVVVDGCDCIALAHHVDHEQESGTVTIRRAPGQGSDYLPSVDLRSELGLP